MKPPRRFLLRPPVLAGVVFVVACGIAALVGTAFSSSRLQGDAPPTAPTIAEWAALPPNAPFTYQITEVRMGDPEHDRKLQIMPASINNAAQVVGGYARVGFFAPFWWRRIVDSPLVSQFTHHSPVEDAAFFWDKGRTQALPGLSGGASNATAFDLNDRGQIVGDVEVDAALPPAGNGPTKHAVLWDNAFSTPRDLGVSLGTLESHAFGINAHGQARVQAAGTLPNRNNPPAPLFVNRLYLWDNNALHFSGSDSEAYRLNDKGESVGRLANGAPGLFAPNKPPIVLFGLKRNTVSLDSLPFINNRGQIAGKDTNGPFLYEKGQMRRFSPPSSTAYYSQVCGMNQNGDVVGWREEANPSRTSPAKRRPMEPFLWRKNRLHDLNDLLGPSPPWKVETVFCLNDRGQIVCGGTPVDPTRRIPQSNGTFYQHVLLLTPRLPLPPPKTR